MGRGNSHDAHQGSLSPQSMLTGTVTAASCSSGSGPLLYDRKSRNTSAAPGWRPGFKNLVHLKQHKNEVLLAEWLSTSELYDAAGAWHGHESSDKLRASQRLPGMH